MRIYFAGTAIALFLAAAAVGRTPHVPVHHAAVIPLTRPDIPPGPLTGSFLARYAAWRASLPARDAFTALPSEADLANRRFELTLPLAEIGKGRDLAEAGWWEYDPDSQRLRMVISHSSWSGQAFEAEWPDQPLLATLSGFAIARTSSPRGGYVGGNAFGATRHVEIFKGRSVGVAAQSEDFDGEHSPPLDRTVSMSPEEARRDLPGAIVRVTGRLEAFKPSRVAMCGESVSGATLDTPIDSFSEDCVFYSRFQKVSVETTSGRVIAEWLYDSAVDGETLWIRKPSAEDIAQYYPDRAQRLGLSGQVTMSCATGDSGVLENCHVVSESPADQGFGVAALSLSRFFAVRAGGGGKAVTVPIEFKNPGN